ncbi:hypothetical protein KCP70_12125 [Salmonella enterica subsp. enterica]|nr:hypothetical protein KCP70_12125 [Salmonella enterica subsp. enterica]
MVIKIKSPGYFAGNSGRPETILCLTFAAGAACICGWAWKYAPDEWCVSMKTLIDELAKSAGS